jgi:hypothetical protein
MSVEIANTSGCIMTVKFSGRVTIEEFRDVQNASANFIRLHGKVRFLALLENFQGWGAEGDWGNVEFVEQYDRFIERIAIVGPAEWKEQVLFFALKDLRDALVEYFPPSELEKAKLWLETDAR